MLNLPIQNISNIGKTIYLFNRTKEGILSIMKDETFSPYFYQPDSSGIFRGYFGGKFNKIICKNPWDINEKRNIKIDGESDIPYIRRYLLDKVNILKSRTKWIMFDIETQSKIIPNPLIAPDPITCITAYCNYDEKYETFYLLDYKSEYEMINAFIDYIKRQQSDLLIAYNSENFDAPYLCYSDDTEILTENGWKLIKNIVKNKEKIKIATLNSKTNEVVYHYPLSYIKYHYRGKMFHQKSNYVDLLVTPNHNLWIKTHKLSFHFRQANNSPRMSTYQKYFPYKLKKEVNYFSLPKIKTIWSKLNKPKLIPMNSWLRFFGFYLTEGWLQWNDRGIIICQSKIHNPKNCKIIEKTLNELQIKATHYKNKNYIFSHKQIHQYLKQFGKSHDKFIPRELLNSLSTRQCKLFLKILLRGDGHKLGFNKYTYCTVSARLANDIQELGLKSGFITNIYKDENFYVLTFGKRENYHSPNRLQDNRDYIDYNGMVYCVEVPNHIVYIRRNKNKYVWCGNCNRFPNFAEAISPINRIKKRNGYPDGISIVDYYKLIKKVYKYKRHSLDFIYSEEFKEPQNLKKYRFDIINEEIKEKNKHDVYKMVRLENRFHLIDYFDEIRRVTKVLWDDLTNYSISIDGLLLQTAKLKGWVLPSKPDEEEKIRRKEEDEILGGYVYAKPGRYEGVSLFDISGTYPNLIVTFNLDPANKRKEPNNQTVTIRKIHITQNPDAIVPTVSNRLINSRQQIQKELESKTGAEYDLLKKQDEAHKSLNNTLYGILLFKNSRIYDKDIADTITYLARFLIRYTKYALKLNGYEVVASDTDSIFVHSKDYEKIEKLCNEILVTKCLAHFGKKEGKIKFKYEGYFENIVFEAPKHYKGNFINSKGEHKPIDKGIEIVRCLDPESIISTSNGWKYLKDIKVGNKIYDSSGYLTEVLDKKYSIHKKFLKIYMEGKRPLICSEYHRIFVIRKNKELLIFAKNIKNGDYLQEIEEIYKNNKNYFNPVLAKILGFFYSEGSYNKQNLLRFCFHKKEKILINEIISSIKKIFHLKMHLYPSYTISKAVYVQRRNKIFKSLKKYLVINSDGSSSHYTHKLPKIIQIASKKACSFCLKALFSGDGSINRKFITYCTTSKNLFEGILFLLKRFGIKYLEIIKPPNLKYRQPSMQYYIYIGQIEYYKFYNLIGFYGNKEEKLKKYITQKINLLKNIRCRKYNGKILRKVKKLVIITEKKEMIDITTKSGDFLCNYIKVHNSDSSKFQEQFLEELYGRILKGETQEIIASWILDQIKELPNKSLKEIAFPFQINRIEYRSIPIFMRALQYTDEIISNFSQDYHNELYYIYVKSFGQAERHAKQMRTSKKTGEKYLNESHTIIDKNVLAFDNTNFSHIKEVDYEAMIKRNVMDKAEKLFDALKWNKQNIGIFPKKTRNKSNET